MTTEPTAVALWGIDDPDAGVDAMLDVLGNRHRRRVLSALVGRDGPVALDDLAEAAAATGAERAAAEPAAVVPPGERRRTALHHVHLPKLDDAGLVDYDADACTVAGTARLRAVAASLAGRSGE